MAEVYILRHGIAEPRKQGRADADRALTEQGREKLALVLARARRARAVPAVILTSPLVRAVQTAALAAETLAPTTKPIQTESLAPGSSPDAVWREIRKHASKAGLLVSGHEPLLGETISFLLGADHAVVDLKKGALACIEIDTTQTAPRGTLLWLITPRVCRDESG
jgi:phosphohistidine phosphatase